MPRKPRTNTRWDVGTGEDRTPQNTSVITTNNQIVAVPNPNTYGQPIITTQEKLGRATPVSSPSVVSPPPVKAVTSLDPSPATAPVLRRSSSKTDQEFSAPLSTISIQAYGFLLFSYVFLWCTLVGVLVGSMVKQWREGAKYGALSAVILGSILTFMELYYALTPEDKKDLWRTHVLRLFYHLRLLLSIFVLTGLVWSLIYVSTELKETKELLPAGWLGGLCLGTVVAWSSSDTRFMLKQWV